MTHAPPDRPPRQPDPLMYPPDVRGNDDRELRWDLSEYAAKQIYGEDSTPAEIRVLTRHIFDSDIET